MPFPHRNTLKPFAGSLTGSTSMIRKACCAPTILPCYRKLLVKRWRRWPTTVWCVPKNLRPAALFSMPPIKASSVSRLPFSSRSPQERTQRAFFIATVFGFIVCRNDYQAGFAAKSVFSLLKQSGNLHSRNSRNTAGEVFHLAGEFFIDTPRRFIDSRANQVLEHLLVLAREYIRFDSHVDHLLLAVHFHHNHAAAGRSFNGHGIHLPLQVFLQLPESRKHLLESADFHQDSSWLRFTSEIFPPKRCNMDRTIGSRSNCARNSCVPEPARAADAAAAATASSLAQTRTARPSTLLEMVRIFSSDSRPSINSANGRFSGEKYIRSSAPSSSHRLLCSTSSPRNFCCAWIAVLISATCSCEIPIACAAGPLLFAGIADSSASTSCLASAEAATVAGGADACATNGEDNCVFVSAFGCAGIAALKLGAALFFDVAGAPAGAALRATPVFAPLPGAPLFNSASNSSSGASRAALISRNNPISRCTRGSGFRRRSSSVCRKI